MQGPTFLIEYDNAQNDGNHVHSVWRDFDGDFGRDLLREHLKGVRTAMSDGPVHRYSDDQQIRADGVLRSHSSNRPPSSS